MKANPQRREDNGVKSSYAKWSDSKGLQTLFAFAQSGLSQQQIARKIGVSAPTLSHWKQKHPPIATALCGHMPPEAVSQTKATDQTQGEETVGSSAKPKPPVSSNALSTEPVPNAHLTTDTINLSEEAPPSKTEAHSPEAVSQTKATDQTQSEETVGSSAKSKSPASSNALLTEPVPDVHATTDTINLSEKAPPSKTEAYPPEAVSQTKATDQAQSGETVGSSAKSKPPASSNALLTEPVPDVHATTDTINLSEKAPPSKTEAYPPEAVSQTKATDQAQSGETVGSSAKSKPPKTSGQDQTIDWEEQALHGNKSSQKTSPLLSDSAIEAALFKRACGYDYEEKRVEISIDKNGSISRKKITCLKHLSPDVRAAIFWLKNKQPLHWQDTPAPEEASEGQLQELLTGLCDV